MAIQPRVFEWNDLESVPQYCFAGNPINTHRENAFSILIPPGEIFFIRSVRNFEHCARGPEQKELIRAFVQQEVLHNRAHDECNASLAAFGVDVDREIAYADRVMAPQLRMIGDYFKPGFHPWKCRDARHICEWIEATEGAA